MIIAVNIRHLPTGRNTDYESLVINFIKKLTEIASDARFIMLAEKDFDSQHLSGENIQFYFVKKRPENPLLWQYWYDYTLTSFLKKHQADIFISMDGCCSLRSKIPQFLFLPDTGFLEDGKFYQKKHVSFLTKYIPRYAAKAAAGFVFSAYAKQKLIEKYHLPPEKLQVCCCSTGIDYKPFDREQKEEVKKQFTDGKEYFFYTGIIAEKSNLINLLKAFTFFKKRQKSNMMLVLFGKADKAFMEAISTYRLRKEVILVQEPDTAIKAKLLAAAYAFVYPVFNDDKGLPAIDALRAEVPVIVSDTGVFRELFTDAALFVKPNKHEDIADKMMQVFKDEDMVKLMIKKGRQRQEYFDIDIAANMFWKSVTSTLER